MKIHSKALAELEGAPAQTRVMGPEATNAWLVDRDIKKRIRVRVVAKESPDVVRVWLPEDLTAERGDDIIRDEMYTDNKLFGERGSSGYRIEGFIKDSLDDSDTVAVKVTEIWRL